MNQWMPVTPRLPHFPMLPIHPGLAGGAGPGRATDPAVQPWAGLMAHGVPVSITEDGLPVIRAGLGGNPGVAMPPEIPGMPRMPGPPGDFLGGAGAGGLFRLVDPVVPVIS